MLAEILGVVAVRFLYLALHLETSSFPQPLNAKQEVEAFRLLKEENDLQARDKIIRHNLRLVAHIAKKYYNESADQEDLISVGTIGLIKAVNTFDHKKGARFATYAARCIENEILMYLRSEKKTLGTISMQEPMDGGSDSGNLTILDTLTDEYNMDEDIEQKEDCKQLRKVVDSLQGRERQVILLRYGLAGQPPMTQNDVATLLGISRSYISRIEKKAVSQLRAMMQLLAGK